MPTTRIDQLTVTRFIAIFIVLFFHGGGGIYLQAVNVYPFSALLVSATTSVTYLYVLSGFVMSLAHYRPDEKMSFESYWKARFVRLYPLYLISFLLICYYYIDSIARIKPLKTLANVFVVQAWIPDYSQSFNFPSWSITVEFFFYAVFPLVALWAARQSIKKLIWTSLIFWALSQSVHTVLWVLYMPEKYNLLVFFPLFHLSSFLLGVAAGIWFLREGRGQLVNPRVNVLFLASGILLASIYVVAGTQISQIQNGDQLMTGLLAPFMTLVIITLSLDKTRLSDFLKYPILITLGEISYAVYILHIPVKWIYERALENLNASNLFNYTYLPLMVMIGFAAYFYIDIPIRKALKNIMGHISFPLLLLDLAILSASVYLSFRFKFDTRREFDLHYPILLLMFWSTLILRTISSVVFNAFNPSILYGSLIQFTRPILISVTAGSIVVAGILYSGYSLGWLDGFFRSIVLIDWAIMLALSLLIRYCFRRAGFYRSCASP